MGHVLERYATALYAALVSLTASLLSSIEGVSTARLAKELDRAVEVEA